MYNRYVPQSDGSFRRCPVEDRPSRALPPDLKSAAKTVETVQAPENAPPRPIPPKPRKKPEPLGNFWKQLLPRDLDTEDLLIVLLLLLMSGDCREDQNTALLTLVLYLFL